MTGFELQPGTINLVSVYHDDWCAYFVTGAPTSCNCQPNYELITVTDDNIEHVAEKVVADEWRVRALRRARRN